jgi:protein-tyrosine phosphatase
MIDIFWIDGNPPPPLAVVPCPHGEGWLESELLQMKNEGIHTLVSLLEKTEAKWLGLAKEGRVAKRVGLQFISHPIRDAHVPPNTATFRSFVAKLANRMRAGERIGVHCRGSIGRATVTAACALIHLGWKPDAALAAIETARGWPVPDTEEQQRWILSYTPEP